MGQYLLTENYTKIPLIGNFFGAILNVILNLILIPNYGIAGAAFATLISYSLSALIGLIFPKTRHQLKIVSESIFYNPLKN
jgi:Na+-driven multidrug efflux pump